MLEELRIAQLGVIDETLLEFGPGLNVLTGETGAGKTMVVTALGLLLGARGDSALVRQGARRALVEARVSATGDDELTERVEAAGGEVEDGVVIVGRSLAAEGRSRATVGGGSVPVGVLGSLLSDRVVVHGQADQHRLLDARRQRELLDAYGGPDLATAAADVHTAYERRAAVRAELHDIVTRHRERVREADVLRAGLSDIAVIAPQAGEDVALAEEEQRLAHADGLRRAAETAHAALAGESADSGIAAADVESLLAAARRALDTERANDPAVAELADRLAALSYAAADAAADLASYAASVDSDPIRLAAVAERRFALAGLTRRYGETLADVLTWAEQAADRLAEVGDDEARRAECETELARLDTELAAAAGRLSALRHAAAHRLSDAVTAELRELAMPHSVLGVDLPALAEIGPHGAEGVAFMLATHAEATAAPVGRGASGGELSRIMLALEVCLAGSAPPATMVFDEVDAGVGGRAAVEIGRRLARLAATSQVIVVTHLPQVAAFADRHHVVVRDGDGTVTTSGVAQLDADERLVELSRMLAGFEDSRSAREHAGELVELARATRGADPPK